MCKAYRQILDGILRHVIALQLHFVEEFVVIRGVEIRVETAGRVFSIAVKKYI